MKFIFIFCIWTGLMPDPVTEPGIGYSGKNDIVFSCIPPSGSTGRLRLGSRECGLVSAPDWVSASVSGKELLINIAPNSFHEKREGEILLSFPSGRTSVHISQNPKALPVGNGINYGNSLPAADALGRVLPSASEAGPPKERYVGMFYWIWHTYHSYNKPSIPSVVIKENPDAEFDYDHPAWSKEYHTFYWGEPLFGFYRDTDEWVLLRHAQMLADAGVDVIIFDATNACLTWDESWPALCEVFTKARKSGVKTPQIAFMLPFRPTDMSYVSMVNLYRKLYKPAMYEDLFFIWDGKPLMMAHSSILDKPDENGDIPEINGEIREYFTFRSPQASYVKPPKRDNQWGWLKIFPQNEFGCREGRPEQMTVGVAQNWSAEKGLCAMNAPGVFGRSYTHSKGFPDNASDVDKGLNFQEQWDYAISRDPSFIFVTGWNEWIMGRYREWQGQPNAFPDQYDQEHSRDIEPMLGGHGDNYYYQLVSNVRRFKGMSDIPETGAFATIAIDGSFEDWWNVRNEYRDPEGDTIARDHPGWGDIRYADSTGRNDIVLAKVADDKDNIYFYVACAKEITPSSGESWMRLFIDVDRDWNTGWNGYDFIVNRVPPKDGKSVLEAGGKDWKWTGVSIVSFACNGNEMELAVPKKMLGLKGRHISIYFKWADNLRKDGDIMDFLVSGDSAPMGRFNYHYEN